jgi:hypothetical protein
MRQNGKIFRSRAGHGRKYGTCALHAAYLRLQKALRIYNTYCFSTSIMVAEKHLNVTF